MKILICVIAYNEEKNIAAIIGELQRENFGYDIVLIDNASTDNTAEVAKSLGVRVVKHWVNTGGSYGTVMTYFLLAEQEGYDLVCQIDGDGQHKASELKKLVKPILDNESDLVIGSRFLTKEGFQSFPVRRIGIKIFSKILSNLIKTKITDATSGQKAYGKSVIKFFARKYKAELFDGNQILLLAHYSGARIVEIPVEMRSRIHGKSEYNFINSVAFPLKGLINVMACVFSQKPKTKSEG